MEIELKDIDVEIEAVNAKTREKVKIKQDAEAALESINERIETYQELVEKLQ